MSYKKENQKSLLKNKFLVRVMIMYIEDYEFLYECIDADSSSVIFDIEDLIIDLIDYQGDYVYYTPLTIA
tara:strand:- start:769 stop:978 length:210 start_codon:yes stop_codon:yes gene_type:complete